MTGSYSVFLYGLRIQSGSGAEKAFGKLAKCIGIDAFEQTAVFIDPKAKQDANKDEQIEAFCRALG